MGGGRYEGRGVLSEGEGGFPCVWGCVACAGAQRRGGGGCRSRRSAGGVEVGGFFCARRLGWVLVAQVCCSGGCCGATVWSSGEGCGV